MSNVFSVHQCTCLIYHTSAYVGAIRRSVTEPLAICISSFQSFDMLSNALGYSIRHFSGMYMNESK